jgi:hypothetical protein
MPTCQQITELATERAEGRLPLAGRLRFDLHVATCRGCRAYLEQLSVTVRSLGELPDPALPPELEEALLSRFDGWKASRAAERPHLQVAAPDRAAGAPAAMPRAVDGSSPFSPLAVLATLAALVLLVGLARERSPAPGDWAIASALAASAVALAAVAGRFALGVVVACVLAAFAAALVGGAGGPVASAAGLHCLETEIAAAAAVVGASWLALRRGPPAPARRALAAGVAVGALAGDAALQVTCGFRAALPHLLVFHFGGVLAAAAGAMLILYVRRHPPAVSRARANDA